MDGVDVPEPMTFAYTEAEFLLEPVSTFRSRLKDVSDEDFRAWMRTQPRIAHLAEAELPEPVTLIGRRTALSLVRLAWASQSRSSTRS